MEIKKVMILLFLSVFFFGSFDGVSGVVCDGTQGLDVCDDNCCKNFGTDSSPVWLPVQVKANGRIVEDVSKATIESSIEMLKKDKVIVESVEITNNMPESIQIALGIMKKTNIPSNALENCDIETLNYIIESSPNIQTSALSELAINIQSSKPENLQILYKDTSSDKVKQTILDNANTKDIGTICGNKIKECLGSLSDERKKIAFNSLDFEKQQEIIKTGGLDDVTLKAILFNSDPDLTKMEGYTEARQKCIQTDGCNIDDFKNNYKNDYFNKLCSANSQSCEKILLATSISNNPVDSENKKFAREKLESMIADGTITLTSEEVGAIILNTNDEEQKEAWAEAYNGIDCSGFFASFICSVKGQDTQRQLQEKAVKDIVQKTSEAERVIYYGKDGASKPEDTFCKKDQTVETCRKEHDNCENGKTSVNDCKNQENFERDIDLYGSYPENLEKLNQEMKKSIISSLDLPEEHSNLAESCLEIDDGCEEAIKRACGNANDNDPCVTSTTDALKQADREVPVTTNWKFTIFDSLKNPDEMALKAAEAFGAEIDFSKIGSKTISQSIPSRICYNKIKGYLDKEVETNGGVTKYGCDDYNETTNPSDLCADVQADLRAQRTSITPDNKTLISYSYYVKDTEGSFQLYVIYDQNEIEQNYTITNETKGSDYDSILLPLNQTQGIDEESFEIVMKRDDFTLKAPIVLIKP